MANILEYIQLIVWVATATGLYFKMKNDITLASAKAKTDNQAVLALIATVQDEQEEIKKDRKEKWAGCVQHKDKVAEHMSRQCKRMNEMMLSIKGIEKDTQWIVKKFDNK